MIDWKNRSGTRWIGGMGVERDGLEEWEWNMIDWNGTRWTRRIRMEQDGNNKMEWNWTWTTRYTNLGSLVALRVSSQSPQHSVTS